MIYDLSKMDEVSVHLVSLSCCKSYIYFHKSKYYEHLVQEILTATGGKWEKGVRWFVSNSARALNTHASGFRVSLDGHAYTNNKLGIGFRGVQALLSFLEERAYINIYKGYVIEWDIVKGKRKAKRSMSSCITFRQRFLDSWQTQKIPNLWKKLEESDSVEIRTRHTGVPISTQGKQGVKEVRLKVIEYNQKLDGADIRFKGERIANVEYKRVFIESMDIAGRIYAKGGGVQLLPQELRAEYLTIDGEPVVELDYSAIHPNICYQLLYMYDNFNVYDAMGEDFCPYDADLSFLEVNQRLVQEKEYLTGKPHNPIRNLAKIALLIGMNSVDTQDAVSGLSYKINKDRKLSVKDQMFYGLDNISSQFVLDALQEHNGWVADKFFSDQGVLLQGTDSKIMMEVVDTMIQKGYTLLTYHDSAIVKQSGEQDLRDAMVSAWGSVLGDTTFCKVDKK